MMDFKEFRKKIVSGYERVDIKTVPKRWGYEVWIANSEKYCGKLLHFDANRACSLHYHVIKHETFFLVSGDIIVQLRDKEGRDKYLRMQPGNSLVIPPGTMHQIFAVADSDLMEFSTEHFESDSYRVSRCDTITPSHLETLLKTAERDFLA